MNLRFLSKKISQSEEDEKVVLDFSTWSEIPQFISVKDLKITHRQMNRSFGLIDNLIIEISNDTSILLGLWILGCYSQSLHSHYFLEIKDKDSDIAKIKLVIDSQHGPIISLSRFKWYPSEIEQFVRDKAFYLGSKPNMFVTKEPSSEGSISLQGFGSIGGACFAAEFFLNFGSKCSNHVNYEYLKEQWSADLLGRDSCEVRIQKLDAEKINLFDLDK